MPLSESTKEKLKRAKEKRGPIPPALLEHMRETNKVQKAILDALGEEAKTVPDLSAATGLPEDVVFWQVNAMRKYNKIHDVKKSGEYFLYAKK
jgi:predicted Rossmann fold nucleotide-binding protein DprA/Smf involved in DNA uptake